MSPGVLVSCWRESHFVRDPIVTDDFVKSMPHVYGKMAMVFVMFATIRVITFATSGNGEMVQLFKSKYPEIGKANEPRIVAIHKNFVHNTIDT